MLFNFILFSDSDVPVEEGVDIHGPVPDSDPDPSAVPGPDPDPNAGSAAPTTQAGTPDGSVAPTAGSVAPTTQAGTPDVTPKKQRQRKSHRLRSDEEEDELLVWVKDNPCLWDGRKKDFKMPQKKEQLWQEKAREKGYDDLGHIHGWWRDIKDQYVKLDKSLHSKSKDAQFFTDRQNYILDKVAFYAPCCSHRKKRVSIPSSYFGYGM